MNNLKINPQHIKGLVLGVDYGVKKIGFALADSITKIAVPKLVVNINKNQMACEVIVRQCEFWQVKNVVLGCPCVEQLDNQWINQKVELLYQELSNQLAIPVHLSNEKYTSKLAKRMAIDLNISVKNKPIDHIAAAIILQSWLNQL